VGLPEESRLQLITNGTGVAVVVLGVVSVVVVSVVATD